MLSMRIYYGTESISVFGGGNGNGLRFISGYVAERMRLVVVKAVTVTVTTAYTGRKRFGKQAFFPRRKRKRDIDTLRYGSGTDRLRIIFVKR